MKHIQKKQAYIRQNARNDILFDENSIFFDIETTGFSPASSDIYLIGCMRKENETLITDQFFAENKKEEAGILEHFIRLLNPYKKLITFNGLGFDIPFIKAKCSTYGIEEQFSSFEYADIFKLINPIKFLLKLPNYKQKTIESFLGLHREDQFSGGELIKVYEDYVKTKSPDAEHLLLLHNFEDITGMLDLLPILSYSYVLKGGYQIKETKIHPFTSFDGANRQELVITLSNDCTIPKRVSFQYRDFYFTLDKDTTTICVQIFEGELKYFYENYKDYFYLPAEDTAMHKSVAEFVDKAYRERAKASNCYTRKNGLFLPQCTALMRPVFQQKHKDKLTYFELTEEFKNSDAMLRQYAEHIFEHAPKTHKQFSNSQNKKARNTSSHL